jgi:transposase
MHPTKYLGVDVAKSRLDLDLPAPDHLVANNAADLAAFLPRLPAGAHLICEATGGYEASLVAAALQAGVPISVLPPQRVRHHARSLGRLGKTDRLDAALLSDYGRKHTPPAYVPPAPERQRLRALLRARTQLLELQKLEANWREHPPGESALAAQAQARCALFAAQLAQLEQSIRTLVAASTSAEPLARLQAVAGIGEVTAWTIWAELPELGRLEKGQPAALCGLAPHPNDSGRQRGKRRIQQGRPQLRRVLFMAALAASQHNHILRPFYQRLRAHGKPAKVALIAVARRLVELLNLILKNPNFILAG